MSVRDDASAREQLAALIGLLQERSERERSALARLLHDDLGGLLAAARMTLSRAQRDGTVSGDADLQATLAELEQQITQAFEVKRRVVEQLRPGLLDHFGPGIALSSLYEQRCRDAGVRLAVNVARDLPALPPDHSIVLYRVGESALGRMLRAGPRCIELSFEGAAGACTLSLRHDGTDEGFDIAPEFEGLAPWLARLQGQLAIRRAAPSGWHLQAMLPLRGR
jgi:signal transduction histidine kinase